MMSLETVSRAFSGRHTFYFLAFLYFFNVALRVPGIFQDLPPLSFCDESMYTSGTLAMQSTWSWTPPIYLAGGANFYPAVLLGHLVTAVTGYQLSFEQIILMCRLLGPVLVSSTMPLFVVAAVAEIDDRHFSILTAAALATLSPEALGISRIFYPDHYIIGPAAALTYLCVRVAKDDARLAHYAVAGLLIGILASIKYSGAAMAMLFAFAYLCGSFGKNLWHLVKDFRPWICALSAVAAFSALNPIAVLHFDEIIKALNAHQAHYTGGHPGLGAANGYFFYLREIFFLSFGILGSIALVAGYVSIARRRPRIAITLIFFPILFVALLGSYQVVINRNIIPILPATLMVMAVGTVDLLEAVDRWTKSSWAIAVLAVLLFAEPVARDALSLRNDFQLDGRLAASDWTAQNIPAGDPIGFSLACWGVPFDVRRNPLVQYSMPATPEICVNHYIMDDWFYQHWGPGNNPLFWPVVSEHIYINPGQKPVGDIRKKQDEFLSSYKIIKKFSDREYYGPTITVYERNQTCPKPN